MNNKTLSFLVVVLLIIVIGLAGVYFFRNGIVLTSPKQDFQPLQTQESTPGEGFEKINKAVVAIDNKEVSKGAFDRVEGSEIYFQNDTGDAVKMPLSGDELAFMCSEQDLDTTDNIDFDKVKGVEVIAPSILSQKIEQDTPVMLLANAVEGVFKVHSVVANTQDCKK